MLTRKKSGNLFNGPRIFGFYTCGAIEWEINKTICNTRDEMKALVTVAFISSNLKIIGKAWKGFRSWLEAVIEVLGGFSEKF